MSRSQSVDEKTKKILLGFQRNEITEHHIYQRLSELERGKNRDVLQRISEDELRHYNTWRSYTQAELPPDSLKVAAYLVIARLFGITFATKLMEKGEKMAQITYANTIRELPESDTIIAEENEHENELIGLIDEEKLNYVGSMVLGLNDALVELTGAVAGLTFALQNSDMVGMAALVTGIAASLSMASSEYLSQKSEGGSKDPFKASLYTGVAYVITVTLLIFPYFTFEDIYVSLTASFLNAFLIIVFFTFFVSVTKDQPFKRRLVEMVAITLGVATISFAMGLALRVLFGLEV
jgi:VIT1/CCC1 family predicted Fe2+/Mn2+ transporter